LLLRRRGRRTLLRLRPLRLRRGLGLWSGLILRLGAVLGLRPILRLRRRHLLTRRRAEEALEEALRRQRLEGAHEGRDRQGRDPDAPHRPES
jgi:hypothetical protein